MAIKNAIKTLLLLAFVVGCSKIQVTTPSSRFISPESHGKLLSGSVRMEQQTGTEGTLDFSGDRTDNPMDIRNNVTPLATSADIGILHNLDFVIKGNTNSTSVYMLKYQIMGKNSNEAGKGDQSLAVGIGYGSTESQQLESASSIFNNATGDIEAEISESLIDLSVIYGYRPDDDTLTYAGLQAIKQNIDLKLESTNNATLNGEEFTLDTWSYGLALGVVRYWEKYYFNIEATAQTTDFTNNDPTTFAFVSAALGYKWN